MSGAADVRFQLGSFAEAVHARLDAMDRERFGARLLAHDDALWGDDPAHRKVAANRLGWLESPAAMKAEVAALIAFAREVAADGFTHAVLLGMGGSSLAPEVLRLTFGVAPGALELAVLDNTSPAAVRHIEQTHDPKHTLFIVSSKSGGTIEVASFEKHFHAWVSAALGGRAGRSFVAITDPGTALGKLAATRGYRRIFVNPPDIGGRYSALSYFGIVPAALIGAPIEALVNGALEERARAAGATTAHEVHGLELGAVLGELARAGRDKLTLTFGPEFFAFGTWAEQLVAESTGKSGRGIVPIAEETLGDPSLYRDDRVFVSFSGGPLAPEIATALDALATAGHPVVRWSDGSRDALGAEFLRWEIATAAASAVLEVDPFDEPNVTEAKLATQDVLQGFLDTGKMGGPAPRAERDGLAAFAPDACASRLAGEAGDDPASWGAALLALAQPGDYFAVLAYLHRTDALHAKLQSLRHAARKASRLATTLGYGPRFLHSTGQLHKGGPNRGLFLQITCDEPPDAEIPGEKYGFAALRAAQAAGDYQVLERRDRRVVRVHLGTEVERGLDRLLDAFSSLRV